MRRDGIEIGVPEFYEYREVFNSDSSLYGGDNILNRGLIKPRAKQVGEMPYSIKIDLPPYGGAVFGVANEN
jgi:1,4-alpha-glucan branching enzyme